MIPSALQDRRNLVRESLTNPTLTPVNGIDFLQIDPADEARIIVQFIFAVNADIDVPLPTAVGSTLSKSLFSVAGGERITGVQVVSIERLGPLQLVVNVDRVGDFSTYTLKIGSPPPSAPAGEPPDPLIAPSGFDPMLCAADFVFHVECAKQFDCKTSEECIAPQVPAPNIDYLARDYPAFVQIMLDRMSLLAPRWIERSPADLGVTVVEVLAYIADQLSYRHDVIDTEAYIGCARLRTSIRRHARLVDYWIDDGSNARAWIKLQLTGDLPQGVPSGTRCCTIFNGLPPPVLPRDAESYELAITAGAQFFEVVADRYDQGDPPLPYPRPLLAANNSMPLYNWSAKEVCLEIGATSATLSGAYVLNRGDFLVLAEVFGPRTGVAADADPTKRCVVRLVRDGEVGVDPLTQQATTRIVWHTDDALVFPLCVSSITELTHGNQPIVGVSVAYGNVILVDHGRTLGDPLESRPEDLGQVPPEGRYRPSLAQVPVTIAAVNPYIDDRPADGSQVIQSALRATIWNASDAVHTIALKSTDADGNQLAWNAVADLLDAGIGSESLAFEAEVENDGTNYLRFGDGVNGHVILPGMDFEASYRVGNGSAGNVAADTIRLIDQTFPGAGFIQALSNPLPAFGGRDAETVEHVRQNAPVAFRTQERAVIPQDYVDRALQFPGVVRAAANFRWTGSWMTVFLTVERSADALVDPNFKAGLEAYLERYRMAGYDLEVEDALRVPLRVTMHVCVASGYIATDIEQLLLGVFTSGLKPDGTAGVFNPSLFLMGEPFYLSPLYAAAQAIEGVASVTISRFEREQNPDPTGLQTGVLVPGPLELFELANDPNYPERGLLELTVDGGL
ncbi:MAG: baseplate J/gp47 family protein [Steroidobacteraceae bacterium]